MTSASHTVHLGPCEARGCSQAATQTAKPRGAISVVGLCDLDALYMVDLPLYQAPGGGSHRADVPPTPTSSQTEHQAMLDRIDAALTAQALTA